MAGRKQIPERLKVVSGTARPHRLNADAPKPNIGSASAPDWLSDRAAEISLGLGAILFGMGVGSPDDVAAQAMQASRLS